MRMRRGLGSSKGDDKDEEEEEKDEVDEVKKTIKVRDK